MEKEKKCLGDFRGWQEYRRLPRHADISHASVIEKIRPKGVYYPKNVTAPWQSWKLRPNADEATQSLSPVPSASQHIYITNSARIHSFCILHQQKVGIGCRQRGRCPFQQHQSRSLSATVGLIADEKKTRREIRFNTCMIDLHHLENGQICLRIYVLDTYTQESSTRTAALLSTWLPRQRQTFSELVLPLDGWPSIIVEEPSIAPPNRASHIPEIYI